MRMARKPPLTLFGQFRFLSLLVPVVASAVLLSCGGGGNAGRGGRGGHSSAPCSLASPVTAPATTSKGVGQVGETTFMDLHLGSSTLPWPTVPFGGLRLWDTSTGWAQINTSEGVYDWSTLDAFASAA